MHDFPGDITIFEDQPYKNITSYITPGVHRVQKFAERKWAKATYQRFEELFREYGGEAGIQRISGYVLSQDEQYIIEQEENYGNIVHDFRWLEEKDMLQFTNDENKARNLSGVHFTTYTAEGRIYLPWIRNQTENYGVKFVQRHIETVNEVCDFTFFFVFGM
uniref:Uncharacterized protein n=1 Tax=Panagrolaimus davidi TaxID=227884 RepID=A0A914PEL5_9BILA